MEVPAVNTNEAKTETSDTPSAAENGADESVASKPPRSMSVHAPLSISLDDNARVTSDA